MVDEEFPGKILLAEANQWPEDVVAYFGTLEDPEFHMAFHFPVMPRMFMAIRREDSLPIVEIMARTPAIPETCQWAIFLRNHDELTLEMVTDEERDYMYAEYAKEPMMRRNVGIRRRLAPLLENSRRKIELMNSLLLSLPGSPVLYYGDEIGMGDNIYLGDRNGVRTPMQWSPDRNAGFSRADTARLYDPPISDPVYGYQAVNVEAQERLPTSLLEWMRRLIRVRKRFRAFGRGSLQFLNADNRRTLAYIRSYEEEVLLCVANLSRFVQPVQLDLSTYEGWRPIELIGEIPFPLIGELPYFLTLGPHSFYWFRLEPPVAT
jgi:maltose alpha-D-glucosyltransferase/alpha-amylase